MWIFVCQGHISCKGSGMLPSPSHVALPCHHLDAQRMVHHQKAFLDFEEEWLLNLLALFWYLWVERNNLEAQYIFCSFTPFLFLLTRLWLQASSHTCLSGGGRIAWITEAGVKVIEMDMWKQPISEEPSGLQRGPGHSSPPHHAAPVPFQSNGIATSSSVGSYWWGSRPSQRSEEPDTWNSPRR